MNVIRLCLGQMPDDQELEEMLYDICDEEHASCNTRCPVYLLNGLKAPNTAGDWKKNRGCDCFKSGANMLSFIRSHAK